jgi:hypothetical protein
MIHEIIKRGDSFEISSGLSQPFVLEVEEKGGELKIVNHKSPRDGNDYPKDIKKLFPKEVRIKLANFNNERLIEELDKKCMDSLSKNQN